MAHSHPVADRVVGEVDPVVRTPQPGPPLLGRDVCPVVWPRGEVAGIRRGRVGGRGLPRPALHLPVPGGYELVEPVVAIGPEVSIAGPGVSLGNDPALRVAGQFGPGDRMAVTDDLEAPQPAAVPV